MCFPPFADTTTSASLTSPLPVSVNIGIDIMSVVMLEFVEYPSDSSNQVTVRPVNFEGITHR